MNTNTEGIVKMETVTIELKVEMGNFETERSGRVGYLPEGTKYSDIVKVFGKPKKNDLKKFSYIKNQVEWIGKINGLVFTIYDYWQKGTYKENTEWNIGGLEDKTAELLNLYFSKQK